MTIFLVLVLTLLKVSVHWTSNLLSFERSLFQACLLTSRWLTGSEHFPLQHDTFFVLYFFFQCLNYMEKRQSLVPSDCSLVMCSFTSSTPVSLFLERKCICDGLSGFMCKMGTALSLWKVETSPHFAGHNRKLKRQEPHTICITPLLVMQQIRCHLHSESLMWVKFCIMIVTNSLFSL